MKILFNNFHICFFAVHIENEKNVEKIYRITSKLRGDFFDRKNL